MGSQMRQCCWSAVFTGSVVFICTSKLVFPGVPEEGEKIMNEEMKLGAVIELQGVKEKINTIETELRRKGYDEPKGFSVLKGYVEDRLNELN